CGENSDPYGLTPGADDDGSGTAAAMEMARVMKSLNYQPRVSIQFMTYAAEEIGLLGSEHNADTANLEGKNIRFMLNNDMIANNTSAPEDWIVNVNYYSGYEYLRDYSSQLAIDFTGLTPVSGSQNSSGSDSYYYWLYGFPVVYYLENEFSPHWHRATDLLENCDIDYCAEIVKLDCAMLYYMAEMPGYIDDLQVMDLGDGAALFISWSYQSDSGFDHFNIAVGASSGEYTDFYTTTDTEFTLSGLVEGQEYYIGLSAENSDGTEGFITEVTGTALSLPRTPANFWAQPHPGAIHLTWDPNPELDLAGYNIYRSTSEVEGDLLNEDLITETIYIDDSAQSGFYY
ncbi:MAG: M28 family peptidase, partial [Planctomycetes bacterium]|nr:M28 family peptidase [Planctomycetota bacterium]